MQLQTHPTHSHANYLRPVLSTLSQGYPGLHFRDDDDDLSGSEDPTEKMIIAHGICMALAFVVLFPLGASWMRFFQFKGLVWFHAGWQLLTYCIALAGLGLGIHLAMELEEVRPLTLHGSLEHEKILTNRQWNTTNGHPIIGIIVVGALLIQPILGLAHHLKFRRTGRPTILGLAHRWWGRVFLVLGAINGGLGLKLAEEDRTPIIVYSVLAGVFFSVWAVGLFVDGRRPQRMPGAGKG